ncbi:ATP synthase subunit I [Aliiglaciecola sp. LCG003]|uniref:N-ATPase subunit AtpR n=1 Tax=Aliiglaciecola sp. LCG003 TaxID=3053655 RepID=UPI002572B1DA|nr:ATP synthase subunit I [Aliiglaciecola sp. LCG003]WJG07700.1 ATP synthase subunit I [Aliiglaciecola sp. LCG003]
MMNNLALHFSISTFDVISALILGFGIGVVFFGSLWWVLNKGVNARHPFVWFSVSLVLRLAFALCALYWVSQGNWKRLLVAVVGFTIARMLLNRKIGLHHQDILSSKEVDNGR